jgi:outer membrane receptor protein involved in Fe transport
LDRPEEDPDNLVDSNTLTVRPGFSWELTRTLELDLSYREERRTYPGEEEVYPSVGRFGEVEVRKRWTPNLENSLSGEWGKVEREMEPDYSSSRAGLGMTYRFTNMLDLEYNFTWDQRRYREMEEEDEEAEEEGKDRDDFFSHRALSTWRFARRGFLRFTYEDRIEDRFDGETLKTGRSLAEFNWESAGGSKADLGMIYQKRDYTEEIRKDWSWGPALDTHWVIASWLAFDLTGGRVWTKVKRTIEEPAEDEPPEETIEDRMSMAEAALVFYIGGHFVLEGGYRYLENHSTEEERAYKNSRYWVMLTGYINRIRPGQHIKSAFRQETLEEIRRRR